MVMLDEMASGRYAVMVPSSHRAHDSRMSWCERNLGAFTAGGPNWVWHGPISVGSVNGVMMERWEFADPDHATWFNMVWG